MGDSVSNSNLKFSRIGIVGKPRNLQAGETIQILHDHLVSENCEIWVQDSLLSDIASPKAKSANMLDIGSQVELVIVVGGDGSMLSAGRSMVEQQVPVVGINRGHLGFLTDVRPSELKKRISEILGGIYNEEQRFILSSTVHRDEKVIGDSKSVNELVLYPGEIAKMLEFELFIDDQFVYSQRSDGLIVSTPTGSTAYSLSGGGPIISPSLDAMVLVPMFPHTLSSRPIVIDANSVVDIVVAQHNKHYPMISSDGQVSISVSPGDRIRVKKHPQPLRILHPQSYDYFEVLRSKLGWGQKL